MAASQMSEVIQHVRRVVLLRDGAGLTDGQLLEHYLTGRDQAALATLVRRHGPMVWGVCRRALHNHHDAEDAFQATFLVLVRKAACIVPRERVANWLYGVAHQTALKARATAAKRKEREKQVADMPEPALAKRDRGDDLLDHELSRLPDKYRVVIVLCDLGGKTRKEAARHLGLPEGTVGSRLARARTMLAKRLTQRGAPLSGGALAAVVPPSLVSSTTKAAGLFAMGQGASAKAVALAEGVLKAMLFNNLKTASAVLLMVVLLGIGGGATALLAGDPGGRVGYQPPRADPVVINDGLTARPGEVALDANGGRNNPYFRQPDPTNINQQWELRQTGDYFMILPRVGEGKLALDANGGRNSPYFRQPDPTNINHLWKLIRVDACYLIVPKIREGELALNANGGRDNPCFSKPDATDNSCLWEFRKTGDGYVISPLVRRAVVAPKQEQLQEIRGEARREIEKIIRRAQEAGVDRQTVLDEVERALKEMKEQAK
jgi:RNA polymerase sigma factor (sigma-70 family)